MDETATQAASGTASSGSASTLGSTRVFRITGRRHASAARPNAAPPANIGAARNPTCSPSQPPSSAPGPAGSSINQRIVLVMRPSSGAGVTACRIARNVMKISTAPTPNIISIAENIAIPTGDDGAAEPSNQPTPHVATPSTNVGPGPKRREMRLPTVLAAIVPTPSPTKVNPTAPSDNPSVRVANKI